MSQDVFQTEICSLAPNEVQRFNIISRLDEQLHTGSGASVMSHLNMQLPKSYALAPCDITRGRCVPMRQPLLTKTKEKRSVEDTHGQN